MNKEELFERASKLEFHDTDKLPPYWEYWRKELYNHLTAGENPDEFYKWGCIYHTMLMNHWMHVVDQEMRLLPFNYQRLAKMPKISSEDYIGKYDFSYNLMHQVYHFYQWEEYASRKIRDLSRIVEIGAGYGAMAIVAYRMGFVGDYYIYDLPEFCLLQEYILSNCIGSDMTIHWNDEPVESDLMIACYSLSEMPIDERQKFLDDNKTNAYLLLFSETWKDYDNLTYFRELADALCNQSDYNFWIYPSLYLPKGNWYGLGSSSGQSV